MLYDSKNISHSEVTLECSIILLRISQTLYSLLTSITMEIWLLPHYSLLVNHEVDAARWRPTLNQFNLKGTSPYQ